jgi:thiol reductant ABC exporter CydC subunit
VSDLRRVVGLLAGHRRWIAAGALLSVLAIGSNVALMGLSAYLISRAALVTNVAELALAITTVRVLAISRAAFRYLERYATHTATFRILTELRVWFYRSIEPLAPARLSEHRSGDLLARIVADIETLQDLYVRVVVPPVAAVVAVIAVCLALGSFAPLVGLVLLAGLLATGVGLPLLVRTRSRAPAAAFVTTRAELNAMLVDEIQGIADLAAFDLTDRHRERTLALGAELDAIGRRLAGIRGRSGGASATLIGLTAVTILIVAIPLVAAGRLDGVYLAALPLAAIASFEAVQPLTLSLQLLETGRTAAGRLFELIDTTPPVVDPPTPAAPPVAFGLEIRGLRFRYEPAAPLALDGLDLSIPAGSTVAVLGPSGAGKSTLVNLLLRFWAYDEGEIRVGGRELRELAADDARGLFGVVSQQVHLFDASIRDNLALADPDVSDERIEEVCRAVQLHDFVASLPEGYRTMVGEDGVRLSGGERQRLAIARAMIRDAPILVLDEATANLDPATEQRLMEAIAPFRAARTTLLISHRPALARLADQVVVVEAGRARPAGLGELDERSRRDGGADLATPGTRSGQAGAHPLP